MWLVILLLLLALLLVGVGLFIKGLKWVVSSHSSCLF